MMQCVWLRGQPHTEVCSKTFFKPVALCNGVNSIFAERLCRHYTSGMFGVPPSQETPTCGGVTQADLAGTYVITVRCNA